MSALYYIQINLFSIFVLIFLLWSFHSKRNDRFMLDRRIFEIMLLMNICILFCDCLCAVAEGYTSRFSRIVSMSANVLYYSLNPVIPTFYVMYCDVKLNVPTAKLKRNTKFYLIPIVLNFILTVASIRYRLFFFLDENNYYRRGSLFLLGMLIPFLILMYAYIKVLYKMCRYRDPFYNDISLSLLFFGIPPIIGTIFQYLTPNASFIWVSTIFTMLLIYTRIQNAQAATDLLTGLFNRGQVTPYFKWKKCTVKEGFALYLIMLDLNDFKKINDTFGHLYGNDALATAADVLRTCCEPNDFIARFGGDEFLILAERKDINEILLLTESISIEAAKTVYKQGKPYKLSFAAGFVKCDGNSVDALINVADLVMYENKNKIKQQ